MLPLLQTGAAPVAITGWVYVHMYGRGPNPISTRRRANFAWGGLGLWFAITEESVILRYSRLDVTWARIGRMRYKRYVNCREAWPHPVEFRQILPSLDKPWGSGPILASSAESRPTAPHIARDCPTMLYSVKSCQVMSSSAESRHTMSNFGKYPQISTILASSCRVYKYLAMSCRFYPNIGKSIQIFSYLAQRVQLFPDPPRPRHIFPNIARSCRNLEIFYKI